MIIRKGPGAKNVHKKATEARKQDMQGNTRWAANVIA
jgi:hypothetical protein